MKTIQTAADLRISALVTVAALALGLTACDVKKTQEGEMPKVNVEGGKMPKYDVDAPEVKVEEKKKTITVPDVDIVTPEEKRTGGNREPGEAPVPPATPVPPVPPR